MAFMEKLAATAETVIIGTATPIQLRAEELWDLVNMLGQGAPQVLGEPGSRSWGSDTSIRYLTGDTPLPTDPTDRWALLRNPMPPNAENRLFRSIRVGQGLPDGTIRGPRYDDLTRSARDEFRRSFAEVVQQCNPIVRRVIRRSRAMLEERKLIKRIAVAVHPKPSDGLPSDLFEGQGLRMGFAFSEAYSAATDFCSTYATLRPASGFMKTILLRRLGSSVKAGLNTTRALLRDDQDAVEDEYEDDLFQETKTKIPLTPGEREMLRRVESGLASVMDRDDVDPKIGVVVRFLRDRHWLANHGSIIFSQFFDTAEWVAERLGGEFPDEPIAVYAGGKRSFVLRRRERRLVERDDIKQKVQSDEIRLVVATDAACEGLNLQRLGSQVNIDLPWNPSKLEQRKGRVQRLGQWRDTIHVVNLRYAGTVEDDVYTALSERFEDIFAVLGQLPEFVRGRLGGGGAA